MIITFVVRGEPMSQGSKTAMAVRRKTGGGFDASGTPIPREWEYTGQAVPVEGRRPKARQRFTTWRGAVKDAAAEAMNDVDFDSYDERLGGTPPGIWPLDGPLIARMVFTWPRPASHFLPVNSRRSVPELRENAPPRPHGKPDLVKLARAVEDSIGQAGLWRDDARIVEYARLAKVYPMTDRDSLPFPGVLVQVAPWTVSNWLPHVELPDPDDPPRLL